VRRYVIETLHVNCLSDSEVYLEVVRLYSQHTMKTPGAVLSVSLIKLAFLPQGTTRLQGRYSQTMPLIELDISYSIVKMIVID
jgi:hypothetical protein